MEKEYDFSKGKKNPYVKKEKQQITINIDIETIDYFKRQSARTGIGYQILIDLYLSDCVKKEKQLQISWE